MSGFWGRMSPSTGTYIDGVAVSADAFFHYVSGGYLSDKIKLDTTNFTQSGTYELGRFYDLQLWAKRTDVVFVKAVMVAKNKAGGKYFTIEQTINDLLYAPGVEPLPALPNPDAYRVILLSLDQLISKGILSYSLYSSAYSGNSYLDITLYFESAVTCDIDNNVSNTTETHSINNGVVNITLSNSLGEYYGFKTAPTATYTDTDGLTQTVSGVVSRTTYMDDTVNFALSDVDTSETITLSGSLAPYVSVLVAQGANSTVTFNGNPPTGTYTNIYADTPLSITATAAEGYYYETTPYVTTHPTTQIYQFTVNGRTATLTQQFTNIHDVYVYAAAVIAPIPTHNFVNNINNSTLTTEIEGDEVAATITAAASDLRYSVAPSVSYLYNGTPQTTPLTVNVVNGVCVATATFNADFDTVTFNGTLTQIIPIETNFNNAHGVNVPSYIFITNDALTLNVAANDGYSFEVEPYVEIWGTMISGDTYEFAFTDVEEPYINATCSVDLTEYNRAHIRSIDVYASAVPLTSYDYGAINVYKVTKANLNQFAAVRLNYGSNSENLGDYVITLKRLYFSVGYCLDDVLRCGNYTLNINVKTPLIDKKTINLGTLTIPRYDNTISDYNSEISAFLPFVGFVNISSDYVGREICLEYVCSAVTGKGFAKLSCDGVCFASYDCEVSDNLIFEKITNNAAVNQLNANKLDGLEPYVIVKHNADVTQQIYNNDNRRDVLANFSGYIECKEVAIEVNASKTIKDLIITELTRGVIMPFDVENIYITL